MELEELENKTLDVNFWNDQESAKKIFDKISSIKNVTTRVVSLKKDIEDSLDAVSLIEEEYDSDMYDLICSSILDINNSVNKLELELLLSGDYDHGNCILEVHAGAGGTEACDWALMLFRMYNRFCEDKGYKIEVVDYQDGDEAGIKKASIMVSGINAYGYLKCEKGVHRLVRLSPFDANNKRHTSFASIDITPCFDEVKDVVVKDEDIKIDVYHSSGAGGQSVNTTDSAVRITHLPTKIVVTCQNERSQLKNKEKAMEILKSKLKLLEIEKQEKELSNIKGDSVNIEFGQQIRSYVMHPYSMVKDHRTNVETSNVAKVLDGDLDMFIDAYLRR